MYNNSHRNDNKRAIIITEAARLIELSVKNNVYTCDYTPEGGGGMIASPRSRLTKNGKGRERCRTKKKSDSICTVDCISVTLDKSAGTRNNPEKKNTACWIIVVASCYSCIVTGEARHRIALHETDGVTIFFADYSSQIRRFCD